MDSLIGRIIFLIIFLFIGVVFNYRVLKKPGFVDTPLDSPLAKSLKVTPSDKHERLKRYQQYARRNFIVLIILLLFLLNDLWTLWQRMTQ